MRAIPRGLISQPHREGVLRANIDQSLTKVVILGVVAILLAFWFSLLLNKIIFLAEFNYLFYAVPLAIGFLAAFNLNVVLIKSRVNVNWIILGEIIGLFFGFYNHISRDLFWGTVLAGLIFLWAQYAGSLEIDNLLNFKFARASKRVLPKVILALTLFMSFTYHSAVKGTDWREQGKFFISENIFQIMLKPLEPAARKVIPEFSLEIKAGELLQKVAEEQLKDISKKSNQATLKAAEDLKHEAEKFLGIAVDSEATVNKILYDAMLHWLRGLPADISAFVPLAATIFLFLTVVGLTWLFRILATFISFSIYELFLALGFIVLLREPTTKEIVVLPAKDENPITSFP